MIKKFVSVMIILAIFFSGFAIFSGASDEMNENIPSADGILTDAEVNLDLGVKSAILMDASSGTVLYASNESEGLPLASVTKIMTLLLVCEALEKGAIKLEQEVIVSDRAASMGGSQIFLEEGERFTVEELLKCTIIASANDAAVALAEVISGSEAQFVSEMNSRAKELGMSNTNFENCTGLDDSVTNHKSSAADIAKMSCELIKHSIILKYSSLWQDSIRNGEFVLTNTNRLVRYYKGCTGLKTGSTDKAGYCVSATAEREGMHLIAVVMGAETRDARNEAARVMLDYGFATFAKYESGEKALESVPVHHSTLAETTLYSAPHSIIVKRSDLKRIESVYNIPDTLIAPLDAKSAVGKVSYYLDGALIGESEIYTKENIVRINALDTMLGILDCFIN